VSAADFDLERVPAHLLVSFRAVDERGRAVGSDRDLGALQARLADRARASVSRSLSRQRPAAAPAAASGPRPAPDAPTTAGAAFAERNGLTDWTFGDLPEVVDTKVAGGVVRGYPAIVDEGSAVALRIEATPEAAARATHAGMRRLALLAVASPTAYVLEHLTSAEKLALAASPYPSAKALVEDCRVAVADAVIARTATDGVVRTRAAFETVRDALSAVVVDELFRTVSLVARILTATRDVERAMRDANSLTLLGALGDIKGQLAGLVFPAFASRTGLDRLAQLPRYLRAALERVRTLSDNPGRDRQRMTEFERAAAVFADAGGVIPLEEDAPASLVHARWLLEEYRVSLFAQSLGTAEPVSLQRIQRALRE
jgi:ATP-dependent helicase HrpA